jgi:hypothetical protein
VQAVVDAGGTGDSDAVRRAANVALRPWQSQSVARPSPSSRAASRSGSARS